MSVIDRLPTRFKYTIHNVVAHPLSEVLYQLGFNDLAIKVHDLTLPTEKGNHDDDQ